MDTRNYSCFIYLSSTEIAQVKLRQKEDLSLYFLPPLVSTQLQSTTKRTEDILERYRAFKVIVMF